MYILLNSMRIPRDLTMCIHFAFALKPMSFDSETDQRSGEEQVRLSTALDWWKPLQRYKLFLIVLEIAVQG